MKKDQVNEVPTAKNQENEDISQLEGMTSTTEVVGLEDTNEHLTFWLGWLFSYLHGLLVFGNFCLLMVAHHLQQDSSGSSL